MDSENLVIEDKLENIVYYMQYMYSKVKYELEVNLGEEKVERIKNELQNIRRVMGLEEEGDTFYYFLLNHLYKEYQTMRNFYADWDKIWLEFEGTFANDNEEEKYLYMDDRLYSINPNILVKNRRMIGKKIGLYRRYMAWI